MSAPVEWRIEMVSLTRGRFSVRVEPHRWVGFEGSQRCTYPQDGYADFSLAKAAALAWLLSKPDAEVGA